MTPAEQPVFALEVAGAPVLTFQAVSHREVTSLPREQWLQSDLEAIRSNGAPLWDGKAKLTVRRASPEESSRFLVAKAATVEPVDELLLVYLVELDHVT